MTPPSTTEKVQKSPKNPKISPLEVRTTQSLGFQVPLGLVMTRLRTDPSQSIAMDEENGVVALTTQGAVSGVPADGSDESILLDTTIAGVSIFA